MYVFTERSNGGVYILHRMLTIGYNFLGGNQCLHTDTSNGYVRTVMAISCLQRCKSVSLFTALRFSAYRSPCGVRTMYTTPNPPTGNDIHTMHICPYILVYLRPIGLRRQVCSCQHETFSQHVRKVGRQVVARYYQTT